MVSINDLDYTGGLALGSTLDRLKELRVSVALAQSDEIRTLLDRYGITERVGLDYLFGTVHDAVTAYRQEAGA